MHATAHIDPKTPPKVVSDWCKPYDVLRLWRGDKSAMRASVGAALTPFPNLSSSFAAITDWGVAADASKSFITAVIAEPNAITFTRDFIMSLITPEIIRDKFDISNAAPSIAPILVLE